MSALRSIRADCGTYTVRPGDTLWALAKDFHTTVADIVRTNQLGGMRIVIGQQLVIPGYPCQTFGGMQGVPATGYGRRGMQDINSVAPGDAVKVILPAVSGVIPVYGASAAQRIAGMLGAAYRVLGVDTTAAGDVFGSGYVICVVQATQPTTLGYVAADCNRAVSAVGYTVDQRPGAIQTSFYFRAPVAPAGSGQGTSPPPTPGVNPDAVTGDPPNPSSGGGGSNAGLGVDLLSDVGKVFGLSTGIPLAAVVVGVIVLIYLKS